MSRLQEHLPPDTVSLAVPGFKPSEQGISRISTQLRELNPADNDTIVLDLLSNSAYMGTNENGLPSETLGGTDGKYHITGSLATAPVSFLKKVLKTCNPLAAAVGGAGVILVIPIPCYILGKCCDSPTHVENFADKDFEDCIMVGVDTTKTLLDIWGTEHGLSYVIIDPTSIANSGDLELRMRRTHEGTPLWCDRDFVHLTHDGYKDLADTILDCSTGLSCNDSASNTGRSTGSSGSRGKRKAVEPVVTMPPIAPVNKKSRQQNTAKSADWARGVQSDMNDKKMNEDYKKVGESRGRPYRGRPMGPSRHGQGRGSWYRGRGRWGGYGW